MAFPPKLSPEQTQHFLALEVVGGVLLISLDGFRQGFFPGPKSYVPFLLTFGVLASVGMIPSLGPTTVIIGGIVLAVILVMPDAAGSNTVGGNIFSGLGIAAKNIGEGGMTQAKGHS